MFVPSAAFTAAFLFWAGVAHPILPGCNEEKTSGQFTLKTFLDSRGGRTAAVSYLIPRDHIRPRYEGYRRPGPRINIEYFVPLRRNAYNALSFMDFEHLFPEPPFPIRSMTMRCGRDVALVGDTSRQPYPLNGIFTRESFLREIDCIAALRAAGSYALVFAEVEGEARSMTVKGRADFGSAFNEVERMIRRGVARAEAGLCRLDPPVPPPS